MIIDCKEDPCKLIGEIGDPQFSICDEGWDSIYRHPNHPRSLRLIDCEHNGHVDVTGDSLEDTRTMAESLCRLLNQDYSRLRIRE